MFLCDSACLPIVLPFCLAISPEELIHFDDQASEDGETDDGDIGIGNAGATGDTADKRATDSFQRVQGRLGLFGKYPISWTRVLSQCVIAFVGEGRIIEGIPCGEVCTGGGDRLRRKFQVFPVQGIVSGILKGYDIFSCARRGGCAIC